MSSPEFASLTPHGNSSEHWVRIELGGGLLNYVLTGAQLIRFNGEGSSYTRRALTFSVPIKALPPRQGLRLVHWAPYVGLASIASDAGAGNPAWAVDDFRLLHTNQVLASATVECRLAVRDVKGWTLRVNYSIHLLGRLAPLPTV